MSNAGGCPFAVDPERKADEVSVVWRPELDTSVVLLAPAPSSFDDAQSIGALVLTPHVAANEGRYTLVDDRGRRMPVVLLTDMSATSAAAALIPLDSRFLARVDAALQLWRVLNGRNALLRADRLTRQRRQRLVLSLRALDGCLAGHAYRSIAEAAWRLLSTGLGISPV